MKTQLLGALASVAVLGLLACERADTPSGPGVPNMSRSSAEEEGRACTNAALRGAYGFYRTGTIGTTPFAAVGRVTYDGAGNWSATQTISRGGAVTKDDLSAGRYEVSADCSGKLFSADAITEVARFALADNGQQLYTISMTPLEIVRGVEKKIGLRRCTVASLNGTYGIYRTGTTLAGLLAAVGIAFYDGAGNSGATQTIRRGETITSSTGTDRHEVNMDCTGRLIAITGPNTGQEFARFVVVDRGNEIFQISLAAGNTVTGVQTKLRRGHDENDQG